jgi:hypothetical protein
VVTVVVAVSVGVVVFILEQGQQQWQAKDHDDETTTTKAKAEAKATKTNDGKATEGLHGEATTVVKGSWDSDAADDACTDCVTVRLHLRTGVGGSEWY